MASIKKRGKTYYAQYCIGGKVRRVSLKTTSIQIAKEKVRKIESAMLRQDDIPIPTRTRLPELLEEYVVYMKQHKTRNSIKSDLHYLREVFGPVCEALKAPKAKASPKPNRIEAACLEDITTAELSRFIAHQVQSRGLGPKSANRYREVLHTLFNWAIDQRGIKMPGDRNPVKKVARYRERAPRISFLSLEQIDLQLRALDENPLLQTMVAVYIYAGLRREEALWLTQSDVDYKGGVHGMIRVRAKTVNGESWEPKTKVNRAVPISSTLRYYLDRYQTRIVPGHWLFPSPEGKRWDCDNFSRSLRTINQQKHLTFTCLDFRHTFGSQLAMKGESLYKIAVLLGNSPEICRRHYACITPESTCTTVEFGPAPTGTSTTMAKAGT